MHLIVWHIALWILLGKKKGGEFNLFIHLSSKLMEKMYNHINFFLLSQAIVTLRSRWQRAGTAKAETMTLTGSRSTLERSLHQIHGCPQVRTVTPAQWKGEMMVLSPHREYIIEVVCTFWHALFSVLLSLFTYGKIFKTAFNLVEKKEVNQIDSGHF